MAEAKRNVHDDVTERMLKALEDGVVPWQKPWAAGSGAPRSMASGERYKGINVLLLGMTAIERSYDSPWWATYEQVRKLGAHVLKGQTQENDTGSTTVVFYKTKEKDGDEIDPATGELERVHIPIARAFRVFNAAQCEGLPDRFYPQPGTDEVLADPQTVLDGYLANGGPELRHVAGDRAYYSCDGTDRITMPLRTQFRSPSHYYATGFHEATHSTGAPHRLNRPGIAEFDHFGSGQYAREELVAQMGSAMLVAETGIDTHGLFDNSAAYINSWLGKLDGDHRLVSTAASQAQRAVEIVTLSVGLGEAPVEGEL